MLWETVLEWASGLWSWFACLERGSKGEWFAGAASVAAVLTALYIARSATKAKLDCNFKIAEMPDKEVDALPSHVRRIYDSWPEQLEITVFNAGPAPAIIHGISMQTWFKKTKVPSFTPNPKASHFDPNYNFVNGPFGNRGDLQSFPVTLAAGESTKWNIILGDDDYPDKWVDEIVQDFVTTKWHAERFRFIIATNRGRKKSVKPGKDLVNVLIRALNDKT